MPSTMASWNPPTKAPRRFAGAISLMYTGASTDEAPMPRPPITRAPTNTAQSGASAQPRLDTA